MILHPKITVVMPFFNAENTLERAIQSLVNQTQSNYECILVDNNSTDKGRQIADKWCRTDKRFSLIKEQNQGVTYAFNKGAIFAKGKYLARMDADDESTVDRLALQSDFLDKNSEFGVVSGLVEYVPYRKDTDGFKHYVDWVNSLVSFNDIELQRFVESPVVNPTVMWRKEIGSKFGLYQDGDFPEDYEMYLRWMQSGVKIGKVEKVVLLWYDSEMRLTRTNSIYSNDAFYRIKSGYLYNWLKKHNPFHPNVVVWGASKLSRHHASFIKQKGINIDYYVDVNKKRQIKEKQVYYSDLNEAGNCFILVFLKHNQLRIKIKEYLYSKGYKEGESFIFVS